MMKTSAVVALFIGAAVAGDCYDSDDSKIADCVCHETCGDCGKWSNPVYEDDCITCAGTGYTHTPIYSDGTGMCMKMDATTDSMDWDTTEFDFSMEEEEKWADDYEWDSYNSTMDMDYTYDYSWDSSNSTMDWNSTDMNSTEWDYPEWEDDYYYTMEEDMYPELDYDYYGYDEYYGYAGYDDYYYMEDYGYENYDYGYYDYSYGEYYPDYSYEDYSYYGGETSYGSWMDDVEREAENAVDVVEGWWYDQQSANSMFAATAAVAAVLALQA